MLQDANADNPYTFKRADFGYSDSDRDSLQHITIKSLPALGTLQVDGTAATEEQTVAPADFGTITWYPPANASAKISYTSFTYSVTAGNEESNLDATVTINLLSTEQVPATGAPELTNSETFSSQTTYNDGNRLLIRIGSSPVDLNGINYDTLEYIYQQSPAADGTYATFRGPLGIRVRNSEVFIIRQSNVGQYIRVCVTFMDLHATPNSEGPLCSAGALVTNVSDQPVGGDSVVEVPVTASSADPHRFVRADFPFSDADGDTINGIRITALPATGTLALAGDAAFTISTGTELTLDQLDTLAYYPDANAAVGAGYATFAYRVRDTGDVSATVRRCTPTGGCRSIPGSTNEAAADSTLTIDLGVIALRLRLFLEGPLR